MSASVTTKTQRLTSALADILREHRLAAGLSLSRAAEGAGLTRQMIGYVESSHSVPTVDTLCRLCLVLKTTPAEVLEEAQQRCKW